jgi:hypothetical protein
MSNQVTFYDHTNDLTGEVVEHALIEHADGSFTSMTKAHYQELEAAKEVKADEAKTK